MAATSLAVTPYSGALLTTQLLSSAQTIVLGDFGSTVTSTLIDDDGTLSHLDDGTATFNGDPVTYIGSGTAIPGVDLLGITVPLGSEVDVMVFEAGGQTYFSYPAGEPNLLGAIALVVDISPTPYTVFTPLCFHEGTMIETPRGEVPIEALRPGDTVLDIDGAPHDVLWVKRRALQVPDGAASHKWLPVRIRADAFGPGRPARDTFVTQQHRIYLDGDWVRLATGQPGAFAPAIHLVNECTVRIAQGKRQPVYHHILCAEHVVLRANGLPSETLLLCHESDRAMGTGSLSQVFRQFPDLVDRMECAAPVMSKHAALAVSHQFAALAKAQTPLETA